MKRPALAILAALAVVPFAHAGVIAQAQQQQGQTWSAWGGDIGVRWNTDLLGNLGVTLDAPYARTTENDFRHHDWFSLRESGGLRFNIHNHALVNFDGGSLQARGGYVLRLPDKSAIDLRNFTVRVNAKDPSVLDIVSGDGKVWFYNDRVMVELADNDRSLVVHAADLRISPELAARIGRPEAANWEIADMAMDTQVYIQGKDVEPLRVCDPYPWPNVAVPGVPGAIYQADLFMQTFSTDPVGCQDCTGPAGDLTGIAGFAPSSTLINNVNDGTAEETVPGDPLGTSSALYTGNVAWYSKFSGQNPPYNNDQHPFLIWNMYRIDANGSIHQIGRSGVKHAFFNSDFHCLDSCNSNQSLGRGCGDTYGVGNNDSPSDMGPRSEIIPATGQWGRCGSIFDSDCNGSQDSSGNNSWTQRMKVPEARLVHASGDGASFLMESWYVARDDIDIYNSMASTSVNPQYSGSQWTLSNETGYRLGPAIDRWVDPVDPGANAKNTELAAPEGHARVAVNVVDLGNGNWRYNYAVMNLDFARAVTDGSEPNLRVVSNQGFDSFSVPVPAGVHVSAPGSDIGAADFDNGGANPNMNWRVQVANGSVTWSTDTSIAGVISSDHPIPDSLPTLDWGSMYSFSFIADAPPADGNSTLHVAAAGTPASYTSATMVPGVAVAPIRRRH